ncbi:hypothetical protein ACVIW0_003881 [Bradyrhizobium sp. USDA 4454]
MMAASCADVGRELRIAGIGLAGVIARSLDLAGGSALGLSATDAYGQSLGR